ncbi:hypothetical protein SAMN06295974_3856 [Plantibacter flavus]|uniref:Uncharacterized protein n=1 Tax=Plantibacter flavus TaxID=150123 RepID=A0A3N2BLA9_9MICO|nr:DUF6611 family protein [Plantibacter flavus]ROR75998.1 hypothetical protein EDD42_3950 [Plantibacter flavus]SMG49502.1 hypothetical protein SAMN06295974_3856 [Plantibacter flavus]
MKRQTHLRRLPIATMAGRGNSFYARWGRLEVTPGYIAMFTRRIHVTLTVDRPGLSDAARRRLAFASFCTSFTALSIMTALAMMVGYFGGIWLGAFVVAVFVAFWAAGALPVWHLMGQSRRIRVVVIPPGVFSGDGDAFARLAADLDALDERTDLDTIGYEVECWRIYNELPERR